MAIQRKVWMLGLGVGFGIMAGCAHSPSATEAHKGVSLGLIKLTEMASGPVGGWLTNVNDYSAEWTVIFPERDEPLRMMGRLLVHGTKFRLEPDWGQAHRGAVKSGDLGLVWDFSSHTGYVVCEPLQGYAPIRSTPGFTNQWTGNSSGTGERFAGQPVISKTGVFTESDGRRGNVELSSVPTLGNLPLKIEVSKAAMPLTLTLSKIRWEKSAEEIFMSPNDFTQYKSLAALLNELEARQQNVFEGGHGYGSGAVRGNPDRSEHGRHNHESSDLTP